MPASCLNLKRSFCYLLKRMSAAGVSNVTVFAVLLHSHLAGRSLKLRHVRGTEELPYLGSDDYYDFNYQETRYLHPHVTMQPTDTLITECVYNTQDRDTVTEGGLGTMQEMCLSFVHYYPKIDLGLCESSVTLSRTWPYLGINQSSLVPVEGTIGKTLSDLILTAPPEDAGKTLIEFISEKNWTSQAISEFETFYNSAEHYLDCYPGNRSNRIFQRFNVTVIDSPYEVPQKTCLSSVTNTTDPNVSITTTSHVLHLSSSGMICFVVGLITLFLLC